MPVRCRWRGTPQVERKLETPKVERNLETTPVERRLETPKVERRLETPKVENLLGTEHTTETGRRAATHHSRNRGDVRRAEDAQGTPTQSHTSPTADSDSSSGESAG